MEEAVGQVNASPPRRGLGLGLQLGLATSAIVVAVLGTLTLVQHERDGDSERRAREALLKESLAPLAADIEQAKNLDEIRERLMSFQQAYVWRGHADHQVDLVDGEGGAIASSFEGSLVRPPDGALQARVSIVSPLLEGGRGTLAAWQDGTGLARDMARQWRAEWVDIVVTVLCILLFLYVANHFLVTRPLRGLIEGLGRMSRGHLRSLEIRGGANEMRSLADEFRRMGEDLADTVTRLVEAERRALLRSDDACETPGGASPAPPSAARKANLKADLMRHYLWDKCRLLETQEPGADGARAAAEEAWNKDAAEAERLGEIGLKARIEDAALRILDPAAFERLSRELAKMRESYGKWMMEREEEVRTALSGEGIPFVSVTNRIKHTASVHRKMKAKGLSPEQVQDVIALRIIVPAEQDCYKTLKVVHRIFAPELLRFKDYIVEPKPSGYRSLHTIVRATEGPVFEVQIRTERMHRQSEGDHVRYKSDQALPPRGGLLQRILARRRPG
ncbi:MAG: hypothetical protein PHU25_21170 [Deltaproteobacteria bacterium]|nr:hypothetical protein [Deltaproteobacteria bacterium]